MTLCVLPFTAKCYRENLAFGGPVLRNECYIPDLTYKVWGGVRKTMYICIRLHLGAFNGGATSNLTYKRSDLWIRYREMCEAKYDEQAHSLCLPHSDQLV
jgi:hypothetical protein